MTTRNVGTILLVLAIASGLLAGGVALNCVASGLLLRERIFDRIWIQPAAGDAGGALGAALNLVPFHVDDDQVVGDDRAPLLLGQLATFEQPAPEEPDLR